MYQGRIDVDRRYLRQGSLVPVILDAGIVKLETSSEATAVVDLFDLVHRKGDDRWPETQHDAGC